MSGYLFVAGVSLIFGTLALAFVAAALAAFGNFYGYLREGDVVTAGLHLAFGLICLGLDLMLVGGVMAFMELLP